MAYAIRHLTPEDEPFLYEMVYQAIFVPEGQFPPPRDIVNQPVLRKYVEVFGRRGDLGFIAMEEETQQPLGAAWTRLLTGEHSGYGYVDDTTPELTIAVLPGYRGRGIGTALLERLIAAVEIEYEALSLSVWPANPAYRLYLRMGFEVVEENGPAVTMVKILRGS